jgi:hypothetical protein
MLGWTIKISIISILIILIIHYGQFCFKPDGFTKKIVANDDLKVQKYKNIIASLSKKNETIVEDEQIEDMTDQMIEYLNQKTNEPFQIDITEITIE